MLHQCRTPFILSGRRTFKEGSTWKCKDRTCRQEWILEYMKGVKILVWRRK